jgi:O-Antigen ligase
MAIVITRNGSSIAKTVLLGLGLLVWMAICAKLLTRELAHPSTLEIAIAASVVLAPFLISHIARVPMYLLCSFAALVPFDELLTTGVGASLTKLLAIVVGVALLLSMISTRRATPPSRSIAVWALLTAYIGATTFWAVDPARAMESFGPFFQYFLLLGAMSVYPISRRDMKLVLGSTIAGALVAAAYGGYLFHSNLSTDTTRLLISTGNDIIIDPNEFACGLLVPIALVLIAFLRSRLGFAKVAWLVALAVLIGGFVVSGSRGATIGIAALGVYMFFRSPYRRQLIVIFCVAVLAIVASPVGQRFSSGDVATADGRTDIWKVGISSLHQYWLAGAGIGNFNLAYSQYFLSTHHQPLPWIRAAHSIFVQSAVEYGLLGFVLAMAVWFVAVRELHHVRGDAEINDTCIALSAGIFGLFIAGLSLDLFDYKYTWLAFMLIALMRSMLVTAGIPISKPVPETRADHG